jgi:hypothetical protein
LRWAGCFAERFYFLAKCQLRLRAPPDQRGDRNLNVDDF